MLNALGTIAFSNELTWLPSEKKQAHKVYSNIVQHLSQDGLRELELTSKQQNAVAMYAGEVFLRDETGELFLSPTDENKRKGEVGVLLAKAGVNTATKRQYIKAENGQKQVAFYRVLLDKQIGQRTEEEVRAATTMFAAEANRIRLEFHSRLVGLVFHKNGRAAYLLLQAASAYVNEFFAPSCTVSTRLALFVTLAGRTNVNNCSPDFKSYRIPPNEA